MFQADISDPMYVDKTGLIAFTNEKLGTRNNKLCVSRPRRFGKSMAISMLKAYYSCGADSKEQFSGLEISNYPSFMQHLNKYNVVTFDVQQFRNKAINEGSPDRLVACIHERIIPEFASVFPDEVAQSNGSLGDIILGVYKTKGIRFIFLIDEWDVVYREDRNNSKLKEQYTRFLRDLFKGEIAEECIALVYMTGILPVPPQDTESALNNFHEFTMLSPGPVAQYTGFTESEVKALCTGSELAFEDLKEWYDGYSFPNAKSIYCPASVINALEMCDIQSYWSESASDYFLRDALFSGDKKLNEVIGALLAGQVVPLAHEKKKIVFGHPRNIDEILISLIHLGYLIYDKKERGVRIPNKEITEELYSILDRIPEHPVWAIVSKSQELLQATLNQDEEKVASAIQDAHNHYASTVKYNDENSLASVVVLAYHTAVSAQYEIVREFSSGKGYADIVFYPKKPDVLPILIELKWNQDAKTALTQIHERRYWERLKDFRQILLVGINYSKDSASPDYKNHTCNMELFDLTKQ